MGGAETPRLTTWGSGVRQQMILIRRGWSHLVPRPRVTLCCLHLFDWPFLFRVKSFNADNSQIVLCNSSAVLRTLVSPFLLA
jgi:hypothetical protein